MNRIRTAEGAAVAAVETEAAETEETLATAGEKAAETAAGVSEEVM